MNKDYNFVNFHAHSFLSTQDALISVKDLVKEAKKLGHCSCTISEHGHLASMPMFVRECEKEGINFRIGVEFYFQWDEYKKEKTSYHLLAVAKNEVGWQNLLKLQYLSNIPVDNGGGFFGRPRVLASMLERHKEGLHISSACVSGPIASELIKGNETNARCVAEYFRDTYESFTIELMPHRLPLVAEVNRKILVVAKDLNIPAITTLDVHIKNKEYVDSYLANGDLRRNRTISSRNDPNIDCLRNPDFWYKGPEEIIAVYNDHGIDKKDVIESFKNTLLLDSMIDFKWTNRNFEPPVFCENADKELEKLIARKVIKKYGSKENIPDQVKLRLREEFDVIKQMNYSNYFLILNDAMEYADSQGIVRGAGRGSAGASLVLYILGITKLNPLDYDLAFSRFLNIYRKSYPDVDLDLQPQGRMALIEYLKSRYGEKNIVQVSNYSEMKQKAALKDAGKWLEMDFKTVNSITSLIPDKEYNEDNELVSLSFDEVKEIPEIKKYINEYPRLFNVAENLSGSYRQFNIHAGAVCVLPKPADEIIPVFKKKDDTGADVMVSQWNKNLLESVSIHKYDLLGLSTLTVLKECEVLTGVKVDNIPFDDEKTWKHFQESRYNLGIFQFIEEKSKKFLRDICPTKIRDLSDCNTLIRPGADAKTYFGNKKAKQIKYKFDLPEVKEELEKSYGAIIYQENLINLPSKLSAMDLGETDLMRRALEKGDHEKIEKFKKKFIDTCKYPELAEDLFEWFRESAQYLFCLPHGIGYSIIAYMCAYYKANFPEEFLVANIRHPKDNVKKSSGEYICEFLNEAREMGIKINLPKLGDCYKDTSISKDGGVSYGLLGIKGIGENAAEALSSIEAEGFDDFVDKALAIKKEYNNEDTGKKSIRSIITKAHIKALVKIGFFGEPKEYIKKYNERFKESEDVNVEIEQSANEALGFEFFSLYEKFLKQLATKYHDTSKYLVAKLVETKTGNKNGRSWSMVKIETQLGLKTSFVDSIKGLVKGGWYMVQYKSGKDQDTIKIDSWEVL